MCKKVKDKEKDKKTKKKKPFYRFLKKIAYAFYKKREVIGLENIENKKVMIVSNHSQVHGPFSCEFYYTNKKLIWATSEMFDKKAFPAYAMDGFFYDKPKRTRWFYKMISHMLAPLVQYVFKNADALPVYKDNRMISTFKQTIEALHEDYNIILFAENGTPYNEIVCEFHDKFVDVARMYYNKYKEEIYFAPMYVCVELKKVLVGKPIKYDHTLKIEDQRKLVCDYLKTEITNLAKSLPQHRVIPFFPCAQEECPMSK